MSPAVVVTEEEERSKLSTVASASSQSLDCFSQNGAELKERNYLGLSNCSSVDNCSSNVPSLCDEKKGNLNLKATRLRLGLPGSHSPKRDLDFYSTKLDEKPLFPLLRTKDGICLMSQKTVVVSGNKRGFADTVDEFSQHDLTFLVKIHSSFWTIGKHYREEEVFKIEVGFYVSKEIEIDDLMMRSMVGG